MFSTGEPIKFQNRPSQISVQAHLTTHALYSQKLTDSLVGRCDDCATTHHYNLKTSIGSRWNNLRDKFVRSLHRKNDPRGAETEPFITKKPFPYKSQMMWLSPFIKKRRTAASLNALAREVNLNFLEHYEKHKDVSQPSPGLSDPSNETNGDTTEPCEMPRKVPLIACKSNSPWDLLLVMTPSEENTDNNDSWTRNETSVPLVENNNTSFKNTNKKEYQQCAKKRPPSDNQSNFPEKFYRKSMDKNEDLINSIGKVSASFDKLVEGMGTRNSVPVSRNGHEAFAQSVVADMLLMSRKDCNMFKREVLELVGKYLPDD
uniref:MADF domain-containing protein n=1 Tax=Timema shepardi TaxID=629360 RepID=A0A7R9ASV9_TIMSH|nr:unnamed protein product [Timema shepardi]